MKKVLLIITGIIIFISVPVIVFFIGQQQELRNKAAPATTLTIQPDVASVPVGETVICNILINTGENRVASAKISLQFDQTKFEALSITNASLAPRILNQGTVGVGSATITVAAENTTKPITGQGNIAVLRLKAINGNGLVPIQFASDTFVAGIGEDQVNVLASSQPGSVTVTGGSTQSPADSSTAIMSSVSPTPFSTPITTNHPEMLTQSATSSALTVYVHAEATRSGQPLIQGTAPAGATVTVVIHSTPPQTMVIVADTNGNWAVTPTTSLASGMYTVVVTAVHPTLGTSETLSSTFTIGGGIGGTGVDETTGDELPTSGSVENTLMLLGASGIMIVFGILLFSTKKI